MNPSGTHIEFDAQTLGWFVGSTGSIVQIEWGIAQYVGGVEIADPAGVTLGGFIDTYTFPMYHGDATYGITAKLTFNDGAVCWVLNYFEFRVGGVAAHGYWKTPQISLLTCIEGVNNIDITTPTLGVSPVSRTQSLTWVYLDELGGGHTIGSGNNYVGEIPTTYDPEGMNESTGLGNLVMIDMAEWTDLPIDAPPSVGYITLMGDCVT